MHTFKFMPLSPTYCQTVLARVMS